jgi:hypothetical protein
VSVRNFRYGHDCDYSGNGHKSQYVHDFHAHDYSFHCGHDFDYDVNDHKSQYVHDSHAHDYNFHYVHDDGVRESDHNFQNVHDLILWHLINFFMEYLDRFLIIQLKQIFFQLRQNDKFS